MCSVVVWPCTSRLGGYYYTDGLPVSISKFNGSSAFGLLECPSVHLGRQEGSFLVPIAQWFRA